MSGNQQIMTGKCEIFLIFEPRNLTNGRPSENFQHTTLSQIYWTHHLWSQNSILTLQCWDPEIPFKQGTSRETLFLKFLPACLKFLHEISFSCHSYHWFTNATDLDSNWLSIGENWRVQKASLSREIDFSAICLAPSFSGAPIFIYKGNNIEKQV